MSNPDSVSFCSERAVGDAERKHEVSGESQCGAMRAE